MSARWQQACMALDYGALVNLATYFVSSHTTFRAALLCVGVGVAIVLPWFIPKEET